MLLGKEIEIMDVIDGVQTQHGKDRVAMHVSLFGTDGKVIVNAPFKETLIELWAKGVTRISTVIIDKGGRHYDIDYNRTQLIAVNGRDVIFRDGQLYYKDNNECLTINF